MRKWQGGRRSGLNPSNIVALLAATLTIFLLSLIGIPMTGGFFAKFYVFSAAVKANLIWLTISAHPSEIGFRSPRTCISLAR